MQAEKVVAQDYRTAALLPRLTEWADRASEDVTAR